MADTTYAAGSTSVIITIEAITISSGLPYTAGAHNTSGLSVTYTRIGSTPTTVTTVTATAGTYTSSGFVHRGKGTYEIGAPTASLASGADAVEFEADGITDVMFRKARVELTGSNPRGSALTETAIADGILDRDMSVGTDSGSTTVRTVRQALRALRNRFTISGGTATFYKEDDSTTSHTAVVTGTPAVTEANPAGGS
jgi:hypothetical protein